MTSAPREEGRELETEEGAQDSSVMWIKIFLAYVLGTYVFLFLAFNLIETLYVYIGYLFIYLEIGSHCVTPALLELEILLPQPPNCSDYRHVPPMCIPLNI